MSKILVLLIGLIPSAWAVDGVAVGTIETVDPAGTLITVKNAQGETLEKVAGSPLLQSERVIAKPDQTVVLHLKDDSNITIAPGSESSVKDYVPARPGSVPHVEMTKGSAHFDVNKTPTGHHTFYIHTSSATMGVRGTDFVVDQQNDGYSVVHTLEGNVSMAKNEAELDDPSKSVAVPAGRTSYLNSSMAHPSAPKVFNRKTYLTQLGKTYPAMMKQIHRTEQKRQMNAVSNSHAQKLKQAKEAEKTPAKRRARPRHPK